MKHHKLFMPVRQIFWRGPEQGSETENNDPRNRMGKITDEARKNLIKFKQEAILHEPTPEEKEINERFRQLEVRKQTIESYLNTIELTETSKGPKFEADKKLVESLKEKIRTICDEIEKESTEIRDVLTKKDVDKKTAQQYIDYAQATRNRLK